MNVRAAAPLLSTLIVWAGLAVAAEPPAELTVGAGADPSRRTITIGLVTDESGRTAPAGRGWAAGWRLMVAEANATGALPGGWRLRLMERDHGGSPIRAASAVGEIRHEVLCLSTFGTGATLPVRVVLLRDKLVSFAGAWSAKLARHPWTPPLFPSPEAETHAAMRWIRDRGGADAKVAIVHDAGELGSEARAAWRADAGQSAAPSTAILAGIRDRGPARVVETLAEAAPDYVILALQAHTTEALLQAADDAGLEVTWVGLTPSWSVDFFAPFRGLRGQLARFYRSTGTPYWDAASAAAARAAWRRFGDHTIRPDWSVVAGYAAGRLALHVIGTAMTRGDLTRAGLKRALDTVEGWTGDGLTAPVHLTRHPYPTSDSARILRVDLDQDRWREWAP